MADGQIGDDLKYEEFGRAIDSHDDGGGSIEVAGEDRWMDGDVGESFGLLYVPNSSELRIFWADRRAVFLEVARIEWSRFPVTSRRCTDNGGCAAGDAGASTCIVSCGTDACAGDGTVVRSPTWSPYQYTPVVGILRCENCVWGGAVVRRVGTWRACRTVGRMVD